MGRPLKPPVGAFQRGNSFGYYLVSPLFVSGVPGRVKSRPVSAFVGVGRPSGPVPAPGRSGSSVLRRTRRRRRLQSAGRPRRARQGRDPIQLLSATLSPYSVHVTWNTQSTCNSTYVVPHARGHRGTPWRSTSGGDQLVTDGRSPRLESVTNHRVTASWKASDWEKDSVFRT
jgi:hypothetical protein